MKKAKNVHAMVDGFIKDRVIGEDDKVAALVLVGALQAGATKKAVRSVTGLSYAAMAESFDRFVANRIFVNGKVATEHIGHDHADDLVHLEFLMLVNVGNGYVERVPVRSAS